MLGIFAIPEAAFAVRTTIALVFLVAAVGKMRNWSIFRGVITNYRLLPEFLVGPVTYVLPLSEATIGLVLLAGLFSPAPEAAAAVLLVLFAVAMAINLLRGRRHIDCGCFQSALKQTLRWRLVARNAVMAVSLGLAAGIGSGSADNWTIVSGLLCGVALFVILQTYNALWSIVPAVRRTRSHSVGVGQ